MKASKLIKYKKHGITLMRKIRKIYFLFIALNNAIKMLGLGDRTVATPECISEGVVSYLYGFARNINCPGDTTNLKTGQLIEVKAGSSTTQKDLTQFSPSSTFDNLCYVKLDMVNHLVKTYLLNITMDEIDKIQVNKEQTVADQRQEGRRARFSIEEEIIEKRNLEPDYILNIKTLEIIGGKLWKTKNYESHHSSLELVA